MWPLCVLHIGHQLLHVCLVLSLSAVLLGRCAWSFVTYLSGLCVCCTPPPADAGSPSTRRSAVSRGPCTCFRCSTCVVVVHAAHRRQLLHICWVLCLSAVLLSFCARLLAWLVCMLYATTSVQSQCSLRQLTQCPCGAAVGCEAWAAPLGAPVGACMELCR